MVARLWRAFLCQPFWKPNCEIVTRLSYSFTDALFGTNVHSRRVCTDYFCEVCIRCVRVCARMRLLPIVLEGNNLFIDVARRMPVLVKAIGLYT